ncbi:hypothetical protein B0H17DRAFT_698933 [Mycena rosella]|uniref:SH3 domain-containing protein n=1 Tax=Mycena rosella TaxID=1033263 RepID=A0AAD7GTH7_MYCRO|nr:hypothetical protein B0H17DRAFT_698933 [Mycena rosella]
MAALPKVPQAIRRHRPLVLGALILPPMGTDGTGSGASSGSGSKGGLPTFAVGLIGVAGALGLFALIILGMRRRAVAKRTARRTWWSGVPAANSEAWAGRDSGDATAGNSSTTRSIRSIEIRGGPGLVPKGDSSMSRNGQPLSPISPISPTSPALPIPLLVSIENSNVYSDANRRTSASSNLSASSAQYISYDRDGAANNQLLRPMVSTPMSVRPFSPSESFAFPAPPREHRSGEWEAMSMASPALPPVPSPSIPHITETFSANHPPAPITENPFADAFSVPTPTRASAEFDAVETIRRPFQQTLQDEMTVHAGDQVKVLAVYDDGWAMIERLGLGKGKGKAVEGEASVGLIPIDCMRKVDESVISFFVAKRVSSVDATGYSGLAM